MLGHWFEKKHEAPPASVVSGGFSGPKFPRHSGAWMVLRKRLQFGPGLRVLDIGYTSPTNVNYLTSLGHSVYLADLVQDAASQDWKTLTNEDGEKMWNVPAFLEQTLHFAGRTFDVVLLWTTLDYLPEPLVVPVVDHLFASMNEGGQLLGLFHTRTTGDETTHCRFHVTPGDDVEIQLARQYPIQRSFSNRNIEKLFANWASYKQYLAKDSVSEVLITR